MPQFDMLLVPRDAPEKGATFTSADGGVIVRGDGPYDYRCGSCKTVLLKGISRGQVIGMIFRCGKCGRRNEIPEWAQSPSTWPGPV